jgi:adrenodoxin-NADP+ reductase
MKEIPDHPLSVLLTQSKAAFTIKEARELMKLPSVAFRDVELPLIPDDLSKLPRAQKRIMELLKKGSITPFSEAVKAWSLDFRLSPVSFNGAAVSPDQLSNISFEKTSLQPDVFDQAAKAKGTGDTIDLPATFAFRSIGYKSEPLPGLSDLGVPFDHRLGIIPNDHYGRVVNPAEGPAGDLTAKHIPGMYCAGWVKRGPTGVIASTMNDAFQSAEVIVRDWQSYALFRETKPANTGSKEGWEGLKEEAKRRGCRRVSWRDWKKIDEAERERGKSKGKEREKFTTIPEMLAVLD